MKLGPWEIRRKSDLTVEAATTPPKQGKGEIGASGTVDLNGFLVSSEYNLDLRGLQGIHAFRRMVDSDGDVQEALEHICAPIRNATWTVEPPEHPDDDELLAAALVDAALFDWLEQPWIEHIDAALDYLAYGHAVFETPMVAVEKELRVTIPNEYDVSPDGKRTPKEKLIPPAQYLTVQRFAPRLQETIWRWYSSEGHLDSIEQQAFKDGKWGVWKIPAEQLLVLTHKRRGDEFTGKSMLRSAYKAWSLKEMAEKVTAVAIERRGGGIIVGYLPESKSEDPAALTRLESILQNLRAGAFSYIANPGPKAGTGPVAADGYTYEILSPGGSMPDYTPYLGYLRGQIKGAVLARFAELGHGSVGARATGDIQSIVWFAALGAVANYLCEAHAAVIKRIVDANIEVTRYPTLNVSDIEVRNLLEFADGISKLVGSGAVTADDSFRDYVRDAIDAPPEDEDDGTDGTTPAPPAPGAVPTDGSQPVEQDRQPGEPNPY